MHKDQHIASIGIESGSKAPVGYTEERIHGGSLGEEQSCESLLCPAMSSYDSGKAPIDSSNFDIGGQT